MNTYTNLKKNIIEATCRPKPTFADKLKYSFLKTPYGFMICSEAADESITAVLEAFSVLSKYKLVVAADWERSNRLTLMYNKYLQFANITLLSKSAIQRDMNLIIENCFVYLQGAAGSTIASLSCAMLAGLPVIAWNDLENTELTGSHAFYFLNSKELEKIIIEKNITALKAAGTAMYNTAQAILLQAV